MTSFAHLLDAEIRRYWARRLVRILLLIAVVAPTVVVTVLTVRSTVTTETRDSYSVGVVPEECLDQQPDGSMQVDDACTRRAEQQNAQARRRVRIDRRIDLVADLGDGITGSGTALMFCAVLIGASFLGAEIGAASLSTQLLYEPRRTRVWTAKALAVGLGSAVFALAVLALLTLELWGGAAWRGVVEGASTDWALERVGDALRACGAAALAGMLAFGVTGVARRTVGAVAGFLAFGMILEPVLISLFNVFDGRLPVSALFALASNTVESGAGPSEGVTSLLRAGTVGAIWTAAFLCAGGALFARREVR